MKIGISKRKQVCNKKTGSTVCQVHPQGSLKPLSILSNLITPPRIQTAIDTMEVIHGNHIIWYYKILHTPQLKFQNSVLTTLIILYW